MTATRRLKIWTLVAHALIVVGVGHGIACIVIVEAWSLFYLFGKVFFNSPDSLNKVPQLVVAVASLLGQVAIVFSLLTKRNKLQLPFYIIGLLFLCSSILFFYLSTLNDSYTHLSIITCLPLLFCTIAAFAGHSLTRFYKWIVG